MMRHVLRKLPLYAAVLLLVAGASACVQRNVERIGSDEAAEFAAPPPPQARPTQSSNQPTMAATRITGVVELAPDLVGSVPENATLYLIVRVAGRETGAPLAVKQFLNADFPLEFVITEEDAMIPGTPLVGEMSVSAKTDQDGNAFTTNDGDLSGQTGRPSGPASGYSTSQPRTASSTGSRLGCRRDSWLSCGACFR